MLNRTLRAVPFALAVLPLACSSDTPTAIEGEPAPVAVTATATPTPVPGPTATPKPSADCPNGQGAVATFEIRVFSVQNKIGELRPWENGGPIYVGEVVRFDSQGKDRFGRRTNGCGDVGTRWDWDNDAVFMLHTDRGWNPRGSALSEGEITIIGNLDTVHSAPLKLTILAGTPPTAGQ